MAEQAWFLKFEKINYFVLLKTKYSQFSYYEPFLNSNLL